MQKKQRIERRATPAPTDAPEDVRGYFVAVEHRTIGGDASVDGKIIEAVVNGLFRFPGR
jgi:hypothetical protein